MRVRGIVKALPLIAKGVADERLYREYVCEALHLAPQNKYLTAHYGELIRPKKPEKKPEEVLADIVKKAGLTIHGTVV